MPGGKRPNPKPKLTGAKAATNPGGRAARLRTNRTDNSKGKQQSQAKESAETFDRKRGRECKSGSEELQVLPKRRRLKLLLTVRGSIGLKASVPPEGDEAASPDDPAKGNDSILRSQGSNDRQPWSPSQPSRSGLAQGTGLKDELSIKSDDGTDPLLSSVANSSTRSSSQDSDGESSPPYDPSPHPDLWISFGRLQSLSNQVVAFPLRMRNDGSKFRNIMFGHDQGCEFIVFGPEVGRYHCLLTLKLSQHDEGPVRRRVVVRKIRTAISPSSLCTTVWIGDAPVIVEEKLVLPHGATIQFGNGDRYTYIGPEFSALYLQDQCIYGGRNLNSSIFPVQRLSDKRPFIAKTIDRGHLHMARTEIAVYKALRRHPRIIRFMESFYESESETYHLILEAGMTDLHDYASQLRPQGQNILKENASRWVEQIASGIAFMHEHDIAHRDIKPQNIIVFISEHEGLTMKLGDMGLARRSTEPVRENWRAGTKEWLAPASFMAYADDKQVDCYGVGRVLFFLLTSYPWPAETGNPKQACGCPEACKGPCVKRQAAFQAVEAAGAITQCLNFLKRLLVGLPGECMTALEMLEHPYLALHSQ